MSRPDRPAPPVHRSVSPNCRDDHSGPCTGCGCPCHDIPAPDLRELAGLPPKPEPEEPHEPEEDESGGLLRDLRYWQGN